MEVEGEVSGTTDDELPSVSGNHETGGLNAYVINCPSSFVNSL